MNALARQFVDKLQGAWSGAQSGRRSLANSIEGNAIMSEALQSAIEEKINEGIVELQLAQDEGTEWNQLNAKGKWDFDTQQLNEIRRRSWLMYIINPLIRRAVTVQELYVWGSGVEIKGEDETINEVLEDFFEDEKNQEVIGRSWNEREREQRIMGDTFFVFFRNKTNGRARVRLLPVDEIHDINSNPEDKNEVWFYSRLSARQDGPILYPDVNYNPRSKGKVEVGNKELEVRWDEPVIHVKTGGVSSMKFGVPELFSALNWATAYKKMLENFATVVAAYARMAFKIAGLPGKKGVGAAKSKLGTTSTLSDPLNKNPTEIAGSTFLSAGGVDVSAVKTANATTGPDEARALRSMVASGSDTPEHFFGDSDIGNFATSTTLDRPTELKMVARQKMWEGVIRQMATLVMRWSGQAPQGKLKLAGFKVNRALDDFDKISWVYTLQSTDKKLDVAVTFPSILSRDVIDRVRSVVMAATLNGSIAEGVIPSRKILCKLLMVALDEKNAEELTNTMYPEDILQGFVDPAKKLENETKAADARMKLGDAAITAANQPAATPKAPAKTSK